MDNWYTYILNGCGCSKHVSYCIEVTIPLEFIDAILNTDESQ